MAIEIDSSLFSYDELENFVKKNSFLDDGDAFLKSFKLNRFQQDTLTLKCIEDLKGLSFFVDKYQRGYKWTKLQVRELLEDIEGFEVGSGFYCLQPIAVKYLDGTDSWELIDGQQRMTTIFLVLSYFKKEHYRLSYKTRESSEDFLNNITGLPTTGSWTDYLAQCVDGVERARLDNVDNYHFFEAWQQINEFFDKSPFESDEKKLEWLDKLLKHTRVVWYNAGDMDSIEIFTRLNSGKIALTNAELIKALFLKRTKQDSQDELIDLKKLKLAAEWDRIEQRLQDNELWNFLTSGKKVDMPNRIELLFDLHTNKSEKKDDEFYTFHRFVDAENLEDVWEEVRKTFTQMLEWFEDDEKFHLIGFVLSSGYKKLGDLLKEGISSSKSGFSRYLRETIKIKLFELDKTEKLELATLRYDNGSDKAKISNVLLLFNIVLLLRDSSNIRFSFDKFFSDKWSLEHIHAQNSKEVDSDQASESITEDEMHGLENMALLDSASNSGLSNDSFAEKRQRILDYDRQGRFIPLATKNVFLKYHSTNLESMDIWSSQDGAEYFDELADTIETFLGKNNE